MTFFRVRLSKQEEEDKRKRNFFMGQRALNFHIVIVRCIVYVSIYQQPNLMTVIVIISALHNL
jgi:hypothetical protein